MKVLFLQQRHIAENSCPGNHPSQRRIHNLVRYFIRSSPKLLDKIYAFDHDGGRLHDKADCGNQAVDLEAVDSTTLDMVHWRYYSAI